MKISRRSLLAGLASTAFIVSSCGDSAVDIVTQSNGNVTPPPTQQAYLGSITMNGQLAALDMRVAGNGDVTATLTTSTQAQAVLPPRLVLSGVSEPDQGNFLLASSDNSVVIAGHLPLGDAQATVGLGTRNGSFAGVLQRASLGQPRSSDSEGLVHGISFFGSQITSFQFFATPDFNGPNPPFPSLDPQVIKFSGWVSGNSRKSTGNRIFATAVPFADPEDPLLVFWAQVPDDQSFVTGDTFQVSPNPINGAACGLRNGDGTWSTLAPGSGGSLTMTAVSTSGMEFDFNFTGVGPAPGKTPNAAKGSFRCSGHYKAVYDF